MLRCDMNLVVFAQNLMSDRYDCPAEIKERTLYSITALVVLCIFLGISPSVRESISFYIRGEKKDNFAPFKAYLKQVRKKK